MKILQLKWSDEAAWKDAQVVDDPGKTDEAVLEETRAAWRADRAKYRLRHDAEFRIVDVPAAYFEGQKTSGRRVP